MYQQVHHNIMNSCIGFSRSNQSAHIRQTAYPSDPERPCFIPMNRCELYTFSTMLEFPSSAGTYIILGTPFKHKVMAAMTIQDRIIRKLATGSEPEKEGKLVLPP